METNHGQIQFFSSDDCKGNALNALPGSPGAHINMKKTKHWKNDKIKSVRFTEVKPGTVIELWDDSEKRDKHDWVRWTITGTIASGSPVEIGDFDTAPASPAVKWERFGSGKLAGHVSHVVLVPAGNTSLAYQAIEQNHQWVAKNGRAAEFEVSDSNYRVWKPNITPAGSGVVIVFKMDHIRGAAKDDHAAIAMTFDDCGQLITQSVELNIAGKHPIVRVLQARDAAVEELADTTTTPKVKAAAIIAAMAGKMQTVIVEAIIDVSNQGGRQLFPQVILAETQRLGTAVSDAICDQLPTATTAKAGAT